MIRKLMLFTTVLCLVSTGVSARTKLAEKLVIELDRTVYGLNEAITGRVKELDVGEKFTLDLVDGYGKVLDRQHLKRRGRRGTPFTIRIRRFSTTVMYVYVKGATERTGITKVQLTPATAGWERFLVFTTDPWSIQKMTSADALRRLGVRAGMATSTATVSGFARGNFRSLVLDAGATQGYAVPTSNAQQALRDFTEREDKNDFSALKRSQSLSDAELVEAAARTFGEKVKDYTSFNPTGYVLYVQPGVTPKNLAVDYSFDDASLTGFRVWLRKQYPTAGVLSRRWNMKFRRWEEVRPLTAREILDREKRNFARRKELNFAGWVDHRTFMDEELSARMRELTERIRLEHRGVRVGLSGAAAPAAYGGYDWSLVTDVVHIVEADDERTKRLSASLNRRRVSPGYTFGTVSTAQPAPEILRQLWTCVADGDLGIVLKPGSGLINARNLPTDMGYQLRPSLLALDGMGPVLIDREFIPSPTQVYVYYSHPSVRVQWMLDALARGEDFRMGESSDDVWRSTWHRNLFAWTDLLDDLGIEFEFLDYRVAAKRGWQAKAKVVILPKAVALSAAEVTQLRRFVDRGGMLVADSQAGLFDAHGITLKRPALDALFGIRRDDWQTVELAAKVTATPELPFRVHKEKGRFRGLAEGVSMAGLVPVEPKLAPRGAGIGYHLKTGRAHAVLTRTQGRGSTVYLNLSLINYPWDRLESKKVAGLRELVRRTLALADVRAGATLRPAAGKPLPDLTIRQYRQRKNDYLFVLRRAEAPKEPPPPPEPVDELDDEPFDPDAPLDPDRPREPVPPEDVDPEDVGRLPGGEHRTFLAQDAPEDTKPVEPADPAAKPAEPEKPEDADTKKDEDDEKKKVELKGDVFKIKLDRERFAYDVIYGRPLGRGKTDEVLMFLPEGECAMLALLDYEVTGIKINLTERPQQVNYRLKLQSTARPGLHPLRVKFINPDGKEEVQYGTILRAEQGDATGLFEFAVNEVPGKWKLQVTDVVTGTKGETTFTLK